MRLTRDINIPDGTRVSIYRNLHLPGKYSVKVEGRVVAHRGFCILHDAKLSVSQAGRLRVLRTGRKNVHAFVHGIWKNTPTREIPDMSWVPITYNPRQYETFVRMDNGERVRSASVVVAGFDVNRTHMVAHNPLDI